MSAQKADHERDRGKPRKERQHEPDSEDVGRGEQLRGLARIEQGLRAGAQDHGCREEEREARRILAPQLPDEAG